MDNMHETEELLAVRSERDKYKIDSAAWEEAHDEVVKERDALKEQLADVVPRSRYDACNRDWLEAEEKLKKVQLAAGSEIADLTRKLGEAMREVTS